MPYVVMELGNSGSGIGFLPDSTNHYLNPCWHIVNHTQKEYISMKIYSKYIIFHSRKCTWKSYMPNAAIMFQPHSVNSEYHVYLQGCSQKYIPGGT